MKKKYCKIIAFLLTGILLVESPFTMVSVAGNEEVMLTGLAESKNAKEGLRQAISFLQKKVTNPVVSVTGGEWAVIGMARNNSLPDGTKKKYLANVYQTLQESGGNLHDKKYTEYARVVLALTSIGVNPSDVSGYNLLTPLADFQQVNWQGINGTIFALLAFDSHGYAIPSLSAEELNKGKEQTTRDKLIERILQKQLADGGWALDGNQSEADMTAMAIQSLTPYYAKRNDVKNSVDKAIQCLSTMQGVDGGFDNWGTSNVESAAQVVIAFSGLNVNLIQDERFVKNGKTIVDYLLTYQLDNGGFIHTQSDTTADGIATEQGTLALVSYERAMQGKTSLYQMSDVTISEEQQEESVENVERFRKKLNQLPSNVYIKDKQSVYSLLSELEQMGKFPEKEKFREILQGKLAEIQKQIEEVEQLDKDIWNQIRPNHITLSDRNTIKNLMGRYERIPEVNKEYVKNREDLLKAYKELKALIDEAEKPKPNKQESLLPQLNENVTSRPNLNEVAKQWKKKPVKKRIPKLSEKTVVAEVKDFLVAKTEVEKVKGKDLNLQMKGKLADGTEYIFTLNGKDVREVKDIHIGVKRESDYEEEIRQLAENPTFLTFEQEGEFAGTVQVEITVPKENGTYLLLYYNPEKKKAEYIQKIEVKEQKTKFLLEKGGNYFIDKKASTKSLKEESKEETMQPEMVLQGLKEEKKPSPMLYILLGCCLGGGITLIGVYFVFIRKRKKKGNEKK